MSNEQAFRRSRRAAWRLAGWQLLVTAIAAGLAAIAGGGRWAVSAVAGGGIGAVTGLGQALGMLRVDAGADPQRFMSSVYVTEALKILLTVVLFAGAIRVLGVQLVPSIAAYAASLGVYWVALGTGYPWPGRKTGTTDN